MKSTFSKGHYHYLFREILAGNISETSFAHFEQIVQRKKNPTFCEQYEEL